MRGDCVCSWNNSQPSLNIGDFYPRANEETFSQWLLSWKKRSLDSAAKNTEKTVQFEGKKMVPHEVVRINVQR